MLFSKSTNGWYDLSIHKTVPDDCVDVSYARYRELFDGVASGLKIVPDEHGYPVLSEQTVNIDNLKDAERFWRNLELKRADIELNKVQDSDPKAKGTVSAWREYRKALRDLPEHSLFPDTQARPTAPDSE